MGDLQRERAAVGRLHSGDSWDEASDRDSTATYNEILFFAISATPFRARSRSGELPPG
jgi:hypothetical protein